MSFGDFLRDALVALGLPYGPQVREQLAAALPELFGRSSVTLSGYSNWLERTRRADIAENFSEYMENRYQRWRGACIDARSDRPQLHVNLTGQVSHLMGPDGG